MNGIKSLRKCTSSLGNGRNKERTMNKKDVIRMAREASLAEHTHPYQLWSASDDGLERFAALAYEAGRADENEACADEIYAEINDDIEDEAYCILVALLARIRARGEE